MRMSFPKSVLVVTVVFAAGIALSMAQGFVQPKGPGQPANPAPLPQPAPMPTLPPNPGLLPVLHVPPVVKEYLELTDEQVQKLAELLRQTELKIRALHEEIAELERQLKEQMALPNPSPSIVGELVIKIRNLREEIAKVREAAIEQFIKTILTPAQKAKLAELQAAANLMPTVQVFLSMGLIEPPLPPKPPSAPIVKPQ